MRRRFAIVVALAGCGGGHHADECERWVKLELDSHVVPGTDDTGVDRLRRACEQVVDGGVPDLARPEHGTDVDPALFFGWIECARRAPDGSGYPACHQDVVDDVEALRQGLEADAEVHENLDQPSMAAVKACGMLLAVDRDFSAIPSLTARPEVASMLTDAAGPLCRRDVFLHYAGHVDCDFAMAMLDEIDARDRDDAETVQAWDQLAARCPEQKAQIEVVRRRR